MIIPARTKDLGGFFVHRVLPHAKHRMVGPFIFFDHMGPAEIPPGKGMNVRPHPHINLATVTYLFEGKIQHRDSLGSNQMIEPGAVNWMTAGRGIVHSERTPKDLLNKAHRMNGIQLWVALPQSEEERSPSFSHHPKSTLPEFRIGEVQLKLLLGRAFAQQSPVPILSELFYLEANMPRGTALQLPVNNLQAAAYVVQGRIQNTAGLHVEPLSMLVHENGQDFEIKALEDSHVMLLGGAPVGPRQIYWNFVSSSKERIEEAKKLWQNGPSLGSSRFLPIPSDQDEFIPLPQEP